MIKGQYRKDKNYYHEKQFVGTNYNENESQNWLLREPSQKLSADEIDAEFDLQEERFEIVIGVEEDEQGQFRVANSDYQIIPGGYEANYLDDDDHYKRIGPESFN